MCFDNFEMLLSLFTVRMRVQVEQIYMWAYFLFGLMYLRNASIIIFNFNLFIEFDTVEFNCQQVVFSVHLQIQNNSFMFIFSSPP